MKYIACVVLFSLSCFASQPNEYCFYMNNQSTQPVVVYYTDKNQFNEHTTINSKMRQPIYTNLSVPYIEIHGIDVGKVRIPLNFITSASNSKGELDVRSALIYSVNQRIITYVTTGDYHNPLAFQYSYN